ncbi:FIST C-terminal domain-containing protein [Leptolyngbya sp. FACHB-261]|nr:FIST C-terminal domain-containing protein [Leptolyngbya sp. FACHB-261]
MHWACALSKRASLEAAVAEVADQAQQDLGPFPPHLGLFFVSNTFSSDYPRLLPLLQERFPDTLLLGCSGSGVLGAGHEIEGEPALSLTLAHLPEVNLTPFYLSGETLPDLDSPPERWVELVGVPPRDQPHFILLASPSSAVTDLLQGLDFAYPSAVKVGGLASGGRALESYGLFYNRLEHTGILGLALTGNIAVESVVAQGCRPIGETLQITEVERNNIIVKLDSRSPLEVLQETVASLSEADRQLAQQALFVGVATDPFKLKLEHGDFLIRNLMGVDPRSGALAIADRVRPGQRIQFHLRDARTSAEDLELVLNRFLRSRSDREPVGALMFSCVGRGAELYDEVDFDSNLFSRHFQDVPLGGFFCNGEIGPVGGTTFLHGFTSVFGIFSPAAPEPDEPTTHL